MYFIYLVAAITGLGGAMLSRMGSVGTLLLVTQISGVFLLIFVVMHIPPKQKLP